MELEKNKKKRSVIRQFTTKLLTKIEASYSKTDIAMDEKLENLRDFSVQLAEKLIDLKHLDSQIETDTSVDEIEDEIIQSQEYQEKSILTLERTTANIHKPVHRKSRSNCDSKRNF
ncbi:hypothetical protein AVEN_189180-1 [Araneus ventricosus]|uniref:Uncharacterized protein n=1 Tax=Araneus ventricosus TaxID=182803 RepID=A0A4Y1ZNJ2_ARAVE|nr:hypothetical protein AVEN_189180-1 [Araneus ventricosus]